VRLSVAEQHVIGQPASRAPLSRAIAGILLVHDDVMIFPRQFPADFFQDPGTIMMTKWRKTCHRGQANAWGHCDKDWGFPAFDSALEALRHKGDERLTALADACGKWAV
jgi:hypothetical protein